MRGGVKHVAERARRVRVRDEVDVLVAGGGLGGVSAAVAAARAFSVLIYAIYCAKRDVSYLSLEAKITIYAILPTSIVCLAKSKILIYSLILRPMLAV